MYKEPLPPNCPFVDAKENEKILYRIFSEKSIGESNFMSYVTLCPGRIDLKKNCKAYGLSFFETKAVAIEYVKRNPALGRFVAEVKIKPEHGKLMLTNRLTGHYTLWLYKTFDPSKLNYKIEQVLEDATPAE